MRLTGTTTPNHSGTEGNGNEEVLCIPESSRVGASLSYGLLLYPGNSMGQRGSYPAVEMLSVYCTAPASWSEFP